MISWRDLYFTDIVLLVLKETITIDTKIEQTQRKIPSIDPTGLEPASVTTTWLPAENLSVLVVDLCIVFKTVLYMAVMLHGVKIGLL